MTTNIIKIFYQQKAELEKLRSLSFAQNTELSNAIRHAREAIQHSSISNIASQNSEIFKMISEQNQQISSALQSVSLPYAEINKTLQQLGTISKNFPKINIEAINNIGNIAKNFQNLNLEHHKMIASVAQFLPKEQLNNLEISFNDFSNTYKETIDNAIEISTDSIGDDDVSKNSPDIEINNTKHTNHSKGETYVDLETKTSTLENLMNAYIKTVDLVQAIKATPEVLEYLDSVIQSLLIFINSFSE